MMFAREGARVAIIDIQRDAAQETVQMTREAGGTADFFNADVFRADQGVIISARGTSFG